MVNQLKKKWYFIVRSGNNTTMGSCVGETEMITYTAKEKEELNPRHEKYRSGLVSLELPQELN